MLLAVDIGNTNITIGLFYISKSATGGGGKLLKSWRLSTSSTRTVDEYQMMLLSIFKGYKFKPAKISGIIISSVVPKALILFKEALSQIFHNIKPLVLGEDIEAPIKNLYYNPKQVGQDRLVNAVGAFRLYGGPVIVVDFGTAITFDVVSKKGEYLGGVIVPGIEISLEALSERAALLPAIELAKPKELLGRDTINSMRSGIFYGFGYLCDGVVNKLKSDYVKNAEVIATGGHSSIIVTYCKSINKVNKNLTLQGLYFIFQEAKN